MSILGFTDDFLVKKEGYITAKEIQQQPNLWLETISILENNLEKIKLFLEGSNLKNCKIIFTGAGTSEFIGNTLVPYLRKKTNLDIESRATTDIVSNPKMYLPKDKDIILVSFARSGNSPESVATVEIANQVSDRVKHIFITCNAQGKLAKMELNNKLLINMPELSNDLGFAMTGSFSCMLLAGYTIFNLNEFLDIKKEVVTLTNISTKNISTLNNIIKEISLLDFERVVVLGSGSLSGLAQEISLKILELCAGNIASISNTPLGFRHGPKSIINNKSLIILLMSQDEYSLKYDLDLLNELKNDSKALKIITVNNFDDSNNSILTAFSSKNDILTSLSYLIPCQMLAFFKSLEQNITPDNPCPTGEVNRVVKGVIIHDYK